MGTRFYIIAAAAFVVSCIAGYMSPAQFEPGSDVSRVRVLRPDGPVRTLVASQRLRGPMLRMSDLSVAVDQNTIVRQLRDWNELMQQRSVQKDSEEWRKRRDALLQEIRGPVDASDLARQARWEDPHAALRMEILRQGKSRGIGVFDCAEFQQAQNKEALALLLAKTNLTGDWVTTADAFAKLNELQATHHVRVMDVLIENWMKRQGPDMAIAWLAERAGNPLYDNARTTAYLMIGGTYPQLLQQMSNTGSAQLTRIVADAYTKKP